MKKVKMYDREVFDLHVWDREVFDPKRKFTLVNLQDLHCKWTIISL